MELDDESLTFLTKLVSCEKVEDAEDFGMENCKTFWRSENVIKWLEGKGYTTYRESFKGPWYDEPHLPFDDYCERNYPFAYHQAVGGLATLDLTVRVMAFT
jgi:hypothetical protein